jgi:hypothetical protein
MIKTMCAQEIESVTGGKGFFEKLGWCADNPFTCAGKMLDKGYKANKDHIKSGKGVFGYYANGVYNIK